VLLINTTCRDSILL